MAWSTELITKGDCSTAETRFPIGGIRWHAPCTRSRAVNVSAWRQRGRLPLRLLLIVLNEAVSALDVLVRAEILRLLADLQKRRKHRLSFHLARSWCLLCADCPSHRHHGWWQDRRTVRGTGRGSQLRPRLPVRRCWKPRPNCRAARRTHRDRSYRLGRKVRCRT